MIGNGPFFSDYFLMITTSCAVFEPFSSRASNRDIVCSF